MTYIGKTTSISIGGAIAAVDSIGDASLTSDEIEDTIYSAGLWKTFIQGLKDGGTVDVTVNYSKADASHIGLTSGFFTGASKSCVITFPDTSTLSFTAFITAVSVAVPKDEKFQRTFTLRLDGATAPVFSEAA